MASPALFLGSSVCASLRIDRSRFPSNAPRTNIISQRCMSARKMKSPQLYDLSIPGGSKTIKRKNLGGKIPHRKSSVVHASLLPASQIASSAFTLGTVAVLPFYTCMVVAPRAELTKKLVLSSLPYMGLGVLYAYLLYLSWTPDTMRMMFASKYWLPELPGIAKMFSGEMTLASAWIHLLAVDLFAARQVYYDGLQDNIETRHSVSLCLLFCPIGILAHFITKALTRSREEERDHRIH